MADSTNRVSIPNITRFRYSSLASWIGSINKKEKTHTRFSGGNLEPSGIEVPSR